MKCGKADDSAELKLSAKPAGHPEKGENAEEALVLEKTPTCC